MKLSCIVSAAFRFVNDNFQKFLLQLHFYAVCGAGRGRLRGMGRAAALLFTAARPRFYYAVSISAAFWSLSFSMAASRILYFMILPAAFIGNESTISTYRGTLCLDMLART